MIQSTADVESLLSKHTEWRGKCLNLTASENLTSKRVRSMLTCDLSHRYGTYFDDPSERNYEGNRYLAELEIETAELAKEIFQAEYVDLRPLGGEMAGKAVIAGLTEPGCTVLETAGEGYGGHGVCRRLLSAPLFQDLLKLTYLPFNSATYDLAREELEQLIRERKPKLIIFGSSQLLFPESIGSVVDLARSIGSYIAYDASHVLGLIAGGQYPNPLDLGADVVHGSTHKTFPGPEGGIIYTRNKEVFRKIRTGLYPALVTNHHLHRIPAFAVQLLEFKTFGGEYTQQIVRNARALGAALTAEDIPVLYQERGYTDTHLIMIDVRSWGGGGNCATRLEAVNIIAGPGGASIPSDVGTGDKSGLRIGTQEITRTGMKEADMHTVAELIGEALTGRERPEHTVQRVAEFCRRFNEIHYCFDSGGAAYEFVSDPRG